MGKIYSPYLRPKRLENPVGRTYRYGLYKGVPIPGLTTHKLSYSRNRKRRAMVFMIKFWLSAEYSPARTGKEESHDLNARLFYS